MENDIQTRIQHMRGLSPSLRLALSSDQTEKTIARIVTTYKLDQKPTVITDAVSDVLLGKLNPKNLLDHLSRTGLDKDTSLHIAHELQEAIFERLRPSLGPLYASQDSASEQPLHAAQGPLNLQGVRRAREEPSSPPPHLEKLDEHERMPQHAPHKNREGPPATPPRLSHPGRDQYLELVEEAEPHPKPRIEGNTVDLSKE